MGKCSHGRPDAWSCSICAMQRIHEEESQQREKHAEAIEEAAWRAEEAAWEAAAHQERTAKAAVEKQKRNIANAWKLQAQSRAEAAFGMFKAGMYDSAIDLAKEAIGKGGDPGNIGAQEIIAWSLTATDRGREARPYFVNQINLLNTPDYADAPSTFDAVLGGLPNDEELLSAFSNVVRLNATSWKEPLDEFSLLDRLFKRNRSNDANHLAQTLLIQAQTWSQTVEYTKFFTLLLDHGLVENAKRLAETIIDRAGQVGGGKSNSLDLRIFLDKFLDNKFLIEAQRLTNVLIGKADSLELEAYWIEISKCLNDKSDNKLSKFLNSIPFGQRDPIKETFQALLDRKEIFSDATMSALRGSISERYKQWQPDIVRDIYAQGMREANSKAPDTVVSIGVAVGALVSSITCFPIAIIPLIWWGIYLKKRIQSKKLAHRKIAELEQNEYEAWRAFGVSLNPGPRPTFGANILEGVAFSAVAGVFLLWILAFLASTLSTRNQFRSDEPTPQAPPVPQRQAPSAQQKLLLSLDDYCRSKHGVTAVATHGADAYAWRCKVMDSRKNERSFDIDMNEACELQHGSGFTATRDSSRSFESWYCIPK